MNNIKEAQKNGIVFNDAKCSIGTTSLPFFGLTFDKQGVHPNENRCIAIQAFNIPNNETELREFLGIATYMSTFIPNIATLAAELKDILKEEEYTWKESNTEEFKKVKEAICNAAALAYFRPGIPTTLQVDASGRGLGIVLLQQNIPIAFASKSLTTTEQRYVNIEREILAIVFGCERFHYYIYGREFAVITDHSALDTDTHRHLIKRSDITRYYHKGISNKCLRKLEPKDNVYVRNSITNRWTPSTILAKRSEPRSYDVDG